MNVFMILWQVNFQRSNYDYCLYKDKLNCNKIYIILYVDNLLINGADQKGINQIKLMLSKKFRMKDLGPVKQYLGIEITYLNEGKLFRSQKSYIESLAEKYKIKDSKNFDTPIKINLKLEPAEIVEDENQI